MQMRPAHFECVGVQMWGGGSVNEKSKLLCVSFCCKSYTIFTALISKS